MQPTSDATRRRLRELPAVARVQAHDGYAALLAEAGAALAADLVRDEIERARAAILAASADDPGVATCTPETILAGARAAAARLLAPAPRRVINATGVVVHTNLGRSVLSEAAARRVAEAAMGHVDLEYDLAAARRGSRMAHLEPLLARLFPGHRAAAFHNNAAAILVTLRALAKGREVIVSRGELVEIGGSFRVPDILAASGARLREVGTTNRTRRSDFEAALGPRTGLLLQVHTSNFKIIGFTEATPVQDLAAVAQGAGVPLVVDWGSGDLVDLGPLGIHDEMPVARILAAGADVVTFSCDKLLGGPQAGIVVGRDDLVARIRKDPLARVCRLDRLLVAALHETLAAHLRGRAFEEIPTLRMLAVTPEAIGARAAAVRERVAGAAGAADLLEIVDGVSRIGGGSSPAGERPTRLLAVASPSGDAGRIDRSLRAGDLPIVGRLHEGRLLLDLRTVLPSEDGALAERLAAALAAELRPRSGS